MSSLPALLGNVAFHLGSQDLNSIPPNRHFTTLKEIIPIALSRAES
jgi:hypothetical protein